MTLDGENVESRMDVDEPTSAAVASMAVSDLITGLTDLRDEVLRRAAMLPTTYR